MRLVVLFALVPLLAAVAVADYEIDEDKGRIAEMCFCGYVPNESCPVSGMCDGSLKDCNEKCCNMCEKDNWNAEYCDLGCRVDLLPDENPMKKNPCAKRNSVTCAKFKNMNRLIGRFKG